MKFAEAAYQWHLLKPVKRRKERHPTRKPHGSRLRMSRTTRGGHLAGKKGAARRRRRPPNSAARSILFGRAGKRLPACLRPAPASPLVQFSAAHRSAIPPLWTHAHFGLASVGGPKPLRLSGTLACCPFPHFLFFSGCIKLKNLPEGSTSRRRRGWCSSTWTPCAIFLDFPGNAIKILSGPSAAGGCVLFGPWGSVIGGGGDRSVGQVSGFRR